MGREAQRIAFDGSIAAQGRQSNGGLLNLSQVRVDALRDPEILAISVGSTTARPALLLMWTRRRYSSEYSTACSNVIARPSARAASKAPHPFGSVRRSPCLAW